MMPPESKKSAVHFLRAPRAAAIAAILFALLLMTSVWLLRDALPQDPLEAGTWLQTRSHSPWQWRYI